MIGAEPYRSGRRVMRPERRLLSCAGAGGAKIGGPINGPEIMEIGDMMVTISKCDQDCESASMRQLL